MDPVPTEALVPGRARPQITVFGSADPQPGDSLWATAESLGRALAQAGFDLVNGGYGGTMEAAARSAQDAGACVTGIVVDAFPRMPNPFLSEIIRTGTLFERLEQLLERGNGYVVLSGGSGTLVELALAWELQAKELLTPRPLVLLGDFWEPVVHCLISSLRADPTSQRSKKKPAFLFVTTDVPEAVEILSREIPRQTPRAPGPDGQRNRKRN
jgi:uncharacterized protein (TIGR00725 family)